MVTADIGDLGYIKMENKIYNMSEMPEIFTFENRMSSSWCPQQSY